jgi:outer membrane protein TolC
MAEGNDQIGIARAAYYPSVTLGGTGGLQGHSLTDWLDWPNLFWAVGMSMSQTLFDGGRRHATNTAAEANYDATVATYRQTTLTAFQEVEDNLAALNILFREAEQEKQAVDAANLSLQLSSTATWVAPTLISR